MPLKRAKLGIESQSEYVWCMIIYTGKDKKFDEDYKDIAESSHTTMTLMNPLPNKDHYLTVDNFYPNLQLIDFLIDKKLTAVVLCGQQGKMYY